MNIPLDTALKFTAWLGLACQAIGVVSAIYNSAIGQSDAAAASLIMLVFGIAIGGWAGNLLEIRSLKARVAALENSTSAVAVSGP
jgi:hypothetical protein